MKPNSPVGILPLFWQPSASPVFPLLFFYYYFHQLFFFPSLTNGTWKFAMAGCCLCSLFFRSPVFMEPTPSAAWFWFAISTWNYGTFVCNEFVLYQWIKQTRLSSKIIRFSISDCVQCKIIAVSESPRCFAFATVILYKKFVPFRGLSILVQVLWCFSLYLSFDSVN